MAQPKAVLLDQEIPTSFLSDLTEPTLTSQLLDLDQILMSFLEYGSTSVLQSQQKE